MQHVMALTIEQLRQGALREPERVASFVLGACRMTVIDQRRAERRRGDLLERYADDLPVADLYVAPGSTTAAWPTASTRCSSASARCSS
jgi:hypothetical protein